MSTTRRHWLKQIGSAGLALVSPLLRAQSAPLVDVAMQLGWIWNVEYAGELMGLEKGYYSAGGLNVDMRPGGPQVDEIVLLMARKVIVTVSDVMTIGQAVNHGAKIQIIGSTFQNAPFCIMSLPDKPIHTPKDLVGKKIGVPIKQIWALRCLCAANNIDPHAMSVLPMGYDPAPLVNRQVDGFLSFVTNEPVQLAQQGIATVSMVFANFGLSEFSDCLGVREDVLQDPVQRSHLKGILRGTIQGWQDSLARPEAAAQLIMARYGEQYALNESIQLKTLQAQIPFISTAETQKNGLLTMSETEIAANIATLGRAGVSISRSLFDTSLIQEVMGGRARL